MLPSKHAILAIFAALAASGSVLALEDAPEPVITPAPTPTIPLEKRQVAGGSGTPILSTLFFPYTALPTQVYPFAVLRGPQFGYNQCGAANATSSADCQTLVFNNASDFCLWGSPDPNGEIGDVEAKVVSYCTNPEWGGRPIPAGAISGVQFMQTDSYIQIVGFIDNTALSLDPADFGGELDPHGADLQGNPLGGVVYSLHPAFVDPSAPNVPGQVHNWNLFVGSGLFCLKACFNNVTNPDYCQNSYDLVGCQYNMPNALQNGTFLACDGDVQTPVGTYTTNGQTITWSMPPVLGPNDPPYTPNTPSSSGCITYSSDQLFANLAGGTAPTSGSGSASNTGASATGTGTNSNSRSGSNTGSAGPSATGGSGALASMSVPTREILLVVLGIAAGGVFVL